MSREQPFSNATEFEIWADRYCYDCVKDNADTETWCPILSAALLGEWPVQWTRRQVEWEIGDKRGSYEAVDTCADFERRRDDGPDDDDDPKPTGPGPFAEEMPGQTDIFTFIVEDALEALPAAEAVSA